ncbi:MAG: hypothetical protein CMJ27_05010 [Phycisphaerae bacterium]|nr:hypothetical protein [Phycisphaerae bacterium]OUX02203.1 MAG: hypothetical protein CBD91_03115 [Phycisphaeraceae bacterium TMED231]
MIRLFRSIVGAAPFAVLIAMLLVPASAFAQADRYGPVDSSDASISVLRRSVGGEGNPANLAAFSTRGLAGTDAILHAAVAARSAEMRVRAVVELAQRGESLELLISRLDSDDERGAAVVAALGEGSIDRSTAISLLPSLKARDIALVAALAIADRAEDSERLERIAADEDATWLTRGLAAAALEQRSIPAIGAWLSAMRDLPSPTRDRTMFELVAFLEILGFPDAARMFLPEVEDRPSNDALRAAVVGVLLELDQETGIKAWLDLLSDCEDDLRTPPIGMLLVTAERAAPAEAADRFPTKDRMSKAIAELVMAAPEDRPEVAIAAIELGHRPTMAWAITNPKAILDQRVLEALLDQALHTSRPGLEELAIQAAGRLASVDPTAIGSRLEAWSDARDRKPGLEILLRGLLDAPGSESVAEARPSLESADRGTRSLALLVLARGGGLDENQLRRLGRVAAGGGGLPVDLRPLAAWLYLEAAGDLETSIPRIVEP